jgi:hypothetical protein
MGVLGEMFPRKRIHEDSDAAQGGEQWRLGPIDLDKGVVTVGPTGSGGGASSADGDHTDAERAAAERAAAERADAESAEGDDGTAPRNRPA